MALESGTVRTVDGKGRITLGAADAGRTVRVEQTPDGYVVRYCRIIPEREAWLYDNPVALALVRKGIEDVKAGRVIEDVDLAELIAFAETIPDADGPDVADEG